MDNNKKTALNYFLKDFWPKYRSQLYSNLYKTYHPSTYADSFVRPSSNFENALETLADAVHEGKKLGLIDSSVDWSDIYHYDDRGIAPTTFNKDAEAEIIFGEVELILYNKYNII